MTWAIFPHDSHYRAVGELLSTPSERVIAVVGGTLLDEAITRTLSERFRDDDKIVTGLLGLERPLAGLGPKIDTLYLLYAFDTQTRKALKGLVNVRNFFAHNLDASFDSLDKRFLKAMSHLILHEGRTHYPHHLYGPDSNYAIEEIINKQAQFVVNLKLGLIILMRDRLSHETNKNQPITEEQLHEKYGKRREAEERE